MYYMGEVFKTIRKSRHISLKEATGNQFSYSMLSRFENGESDISASKFLIALNNIHAELSEFVYLFRGFQPTPYDLFRNQILEQCDKKNLSELHRLYQEELDKHKQDSNDNHLLNTLIIKGYMMLLSDNIALTSVEQEFLHNYLFAVDIWGSYELKIFTDVSPLLSIELYFQYTREMLKRIDFFDTLPAHKNQIHTILLNGLFKSIEQEHLNSAAYFNKQIKNRYFEEADAYLRTVYLFASGQHDYLLGNKTDGLKKINDAILVLQLLGCVESANYYKEQKEKWLLKFE